MLDSVLSIIGTDTFWVALGAIGALVALILTYLQLRASRIIAAADFLLRLENAFSATDMLVKRKQILLILKETPNDFRRMDTYRDVFDFFEEVGLLVRKRIIPTDLAWSDYCAWTLWYWSAFRGYIDWARRSDEDPTLYCEFEFLFNTMLKFERRKLKRKVVVTPEKIAEFIEEEIGLLSNEIKCM
ncbi:MAG: hypothetical protein NWE94_03415 [Candidatus Bathyarchaeota archaeon]|nr:hypothetical protein [Candidatus Bathyarchaeota archaeon]